MIAEQRQRFGADFVFRCRGTVAPAVASFGSCCQEWEEREKINNQAGHDDAALRENGAFRPTSEGGRSERTRSYAMALEGARVICEIFHKVPFSGVPSGKMSSSGPTGIAFNTGGSGVTRSSPGVSNDGAVPPNFALSRTY